MVLPRGTSQTPLPETSEGTNPEIGPLLPSNGGKQPLGLPAEAQRTWLP